MAILKSEIVGKSLLDLSDLIKGMPGSNKHHCEWKSLPTKHFDFISKCTLCFTNSYGATYKIDPNYELMIKHTTNGISYPLESYGKLLNMIVTDYDDSTQSSQEQPMYLDRKPIVGDYVERIRRYDARMDEGSIWKVTAIPTSSSIVVTDQRGNWDSNKFKVINPDHPSHPNYQEQPMPTSQDIKAGSHWERINYYSYDNPDGEVIRVEKVNRNFVYFNKGRNRGIKNFLEHFKPRPDLDTPADNTNVSCEFSIGDLICYTQEARDRLKSAKGTLPNEIIGTVTEVTDRSKLGSTSLLEYKDIHSNIDTIDSGWVTKYVATPIKKQTAKPKQKPVAQSEPTQSITKETFMSKLKTVASTTVDQNKQALVIASKMEAGRIINKQVLKQLKPHLPFFLQGYASSPFAPLLAANLVAMASNYVDDSRVKKVSELMLLGAADSGVSSLNISKIIDDVLSNIKLPAGVLDDSDDE